MSSDEGVGAVSEFAETQELPVPGETPAEFAESIEPSVTTADTGTAAAPDESATAAAGPRVKYEGEGVYVGNEPPEGYSIKGNERSMKYHVPESSAYGRTTAEVWFNSEEAAQRAGFVRAQH